jgi:transposase
LRDYTRLRCDLTGDRTRQVQRLEKLLEDALIKLGTVATDIMGVSGRAMPEALAAGQRDPRRSPSWPGGGCAASAAPWWRR